MISVRTFFLLLVAASLTGCYIVVDDGSGRTDSRDYHGGGEYYGGMPWIDTNYSGWYCESEYHSGNWTSYWDLHALAGDPDGLGDIISVDVYMYDYYGYETFWAKFGFPSSWYNSSNNGAVEGEFSYSGYISGGCEQGYDIEYVVEDSSGNISAYWIY